MKMLRVAISLLLLAGSAFAIWRYASPQPALMTLSNARATLHQMDGTQAVAVSLSITNGGGPDRILRAVSPEAKLVMFHGVTDLKGAPVPAGASPTLGLDGAHIMLMGLQGETAAGRLIPLTITFETAGDVTTKATLTADVMGMDMSGQGMHHSMDHSESIHMPTATAPTIAVSAVPAGDGWRIQADVERFTFAPEAMDGDHVAGEGHGHLYVGGLKIMRMTSPEVVIGALPPGEYEVRVTLNSNDHKAYHSDAGPVTAVTSIAVEE